MLRKGYVNSSSGNNTTNNQTLPQDEVSHSETSCNDNNFNNTSTVDSSLLGLESLHKAYEQWVHGTFYRLNVYFNKAVVIKHAQVRF